MPGASRQRHHLMSIALGCDGSLFDLDGPLPEIPKSNASKSGHNRVIERARRDNLTVHQIGADRRRLWRPRDGRHALDDRRQDGVVALQRRLRRLQHHVPVGPGRSRRFRRPGRPRTAASQPLPPRIRRPHPARKPRVAPPGEPLLREAGILSRSTGACRPKGAREFRRSKAGTGRDHGCWFRGRFRVLAANGRPGGNLIAIGP